jgi:hypothetical protein
LKIGPIAGGGMPPTYESMQQTKVLASMPIRKSIRAAARRVVRQSALKFFTDRNQERELLRHFFERLPRVHRVHDVRPAKPILRNRDRKGLLAKRGLTPESMTEKDMEAELG